MLTDPGDDNVSDAYMEVMFVEGEKEAEWEWEGEPMVLKVSPPTVAIPELYGSVEDLQSRLNGVGAILIPVLFPPCPVQD